MWLSNDRSSLAPSAALRRGLRGRSFCVSVGATSSRATQENRQWRSKSFSSKGKDRSAALLFSGVVLSAQIAAAQPHTTTPQAAPVSTGALSVESVKTFLDPLGSLLAEIIFFIAWSWDYLMNHPPLAVLIAATIATWMALRSIATARSVARLKETFSLLDKTNWDRDVIRARRVFSRIREECKQSPQAIAIYAYEFSDPGNSRIREEYKQSLQAIAIYAYEFSDPANLDEKKLNDLRSEHEERCTLLRSILNANENMALGVKRGIIDETYLYKALKQNMIRDWKSLSPLVYAYRDKLSSHVAFIEFEGLVSAWEKDIPYGPAKRVYETQKDTKFK
jgi:hypothetical protein